MATFQTIRAALVATVSAIPAQIPVAMVFDHEPQIGDVTQDPFAAVIPSGNESDYISTSENRRTYAFLIRLFVERNQRGADQAESVLEDLVDTLLDDFDQDFTLGGIALLVRAAPSRWGYVLGDREYRTAEITIQVITDFQVQ